MQGVSECLAVQPIAVDRVDELSRFTNLVTEPMTTASSIHCSSVVFDRDFWALSIEQQEPGFHLNDHTTIDESVSTSSTTVTLVEFSW